MDHPDAMAAHRDHDGARQLQAAQAVVVAAHRHHRGEGAEVVENRGDAEVARVEDQVAALERRQHRVGQRLHELADVRVGDDADARQLRYRRASAARATPRSTSRPTRSG